jgi:serine/threonine protein phosphatase PrpC
MQVSCYPDISVHERQSTDDLLLLACDGLWDVMSSAEAVGQMRALLEAGETSMVKIAEEMLDISLNKGSQMFYSIILLLRYSIANLDKSSRA